jgi:DNA-binding response OmpR family regulator
VSEEIPRRPVVLVADDDADILELVSLKLARAGYEVLAAADGERALELAVEHRPNVAVLDVMMPKLTGFEVTRRLRAGEPTASLPILLLTARVRDQDLAAGIAAGADDYMRKPFGTHELVERVQALLGRSWPLAVSGDEVRVTAVHR